MPAEKYRARFFAQFILSGQSEILRCAQDDSEGPRMTTRQTSPRMSRCHPGGPAALGGRIRVTLTPFGTLRLRFFPQPTR